MKKILFPTDFSDNALHASKYASMLAKRLNAKIIMLHIYSNPVFTEFQLPYTVQNFEDKVRENEDKFLNDFAKKFLNETGFATELLTKVNEYGTTPGDDIVVFAKNQKVDFIVMGTKGASGYFEKLLGTNAQSVMNKSDCPVWIIPEDANLSYPELIMYAADYKEDEILATNTIIEITKPLGIKYKVVHIRDYFEMNVVQSVKEIADDLKDRFEGQEIEFKNLNRTSVIEALETYIQTIKPDVLSLAVHDKSFLSKIFDTSITKHFVQQAKLPLLTFRKNPVWADL